MHTYGTLPHLTDWLKTKAADDTYQGESYKNCLIVQYARAFDKLAADEFYVAASHTIPLEEWAEVSVVAHGTGSRLTEYTFGTALGRAEELLAKRVVA